MSYVEAGLRVRTVMVDHLINRCRDLKQPLLGKKGIIHDAATTARVIDMQAEHLRDSSAGLVYLAAQLKVSVDNCLKK